MHPAVYLDEVLGLNTGWPIPSKCLFQLATPAGFEPATFSLEGCWPWISQQRGELSISSFRTYPCFVEYACIA